MRVQLVVVAAVAALSGRAQEGPQASAPMTQCQAAVAIVSNPYSLTGQVEMALEVYRNKCLGSTPDGSRRLLPAPVAKVNTYTAADAEFEREMTQ